MRELVLAFLILFSTNSFSKEKFSRFSKNKLASSHRDGKILNVQNVYNGELRKLDCSKVSVPSEYEIYFLNAGINPIVRDSNPLNEFISLSKDRLYFESLSDAEHIFSSYFSDKYFLNIEKYLTKNSKYIEIGNHEMDVPLLGKKTNVRINVLSNLSGIRESKKRESHPFEIQISNEVSLVGWGNGSSQVATRDAVNRVFRYFVENVCTK